MYDDLIRRLYRAAEPSRTLDQEIAYISGYQLVSDTGAWRSPAGDIVPRVPYFTESIDHAVEFASLTGSLGRGGCSWESNRASAVLDDFVVEAANPAIAICMAALVRLQRGTKDAG